MISAEKSISLAATDPAVSNANSIATGSVPHLRLLDLVFTKNIDAKINDSKTGSRKPH